MMAVRFCFSHFIVNASVATANFGYIIEFIIIGSSSIIIFLPSVAYDPQGFQKLDRLQKKLQN